MGGIHVSKNGKTFTRTYTFGKGESSYDAETKAILKAIEYVEEYKIDDNIIIITDCQSTLHNMKKRKTLTQDEYQIIKKMENLTRINGNKIKMMYTPGHAGIKMNEKVDNAITFASKTQHSEVNVELLPSLQISHQAVKKTIQRTIQIAEKELLEKLKTSSHIIKGNDTSHTAINMINLDVNRTKVKKWMKYLIGNRQEQTILGRIISYGYFRIFGNQLSCPYCPCILSSEHILIHCPIMEPYIKKAC